MKRLIRIFMPLAGCVLLSGCAGYKALQLEDLTVKARANASVETPTGKIYYAHKVLTAEESRRYLGADVIAKGYQPIQVAIINATEIPYLFAYKNQPIPLIHIQDVLSSMHDRTWMRALGWGSAAGTMAAAYPLFALGIAGSETGAMVSFIPLWFNPIFYFCVISAAAFGYAALQDTLWSKEANAMMTIDYETKALRETLIQDGSSVNGLVFVDATTSLRDFNIVLTDSITGAQITLS